MCVCVVAKNLVYIAITIGNVPLSPSVSYTITIEGVCHC